jgi:hypothetical protein
MPLPLSPAKKNQPREDRDQYYETACDYQCMLEMFHFRADRVLRLFAQPSSLTPEGLRKSSSIASAPSHWRSRRHRIRRRHQPTTNTTVSGLSIK